MLLRRLSGGQTAAARRMTEDWGGLVAAVPGASLLLSARRGAALPAASRPLAVPSSRRVLGTAPALTQFPLSPRAKPTDVTQRSPGPPPPPPPPPPAVKGATAAAPDAFTAAVPQSRRARQRPTGSVLDAATPLKVSPQSGATAHVWQTPTAGWPRMGLIKRGCGVPSRWQRMSSGGSSGRPLEGPTVFRAPQPTPLRSGDAPWVKHLQIHTNNEAHT